MPSHASNVVPLLYPHPIDRELTEEYLSRRFMQPTRMAENISYEFTRDPGLVHQYCRLREDMFISVWGLKHFSGEHDTYDDCSDILIARKGLQCVAGGRLTVTDGTQPKRLPMEGDDLVLADLLPELNLAECNYGEFSRLAILPEFRGGAVFPEIARRFIKRAIAQDVRYAFNIAPLPLARSYRQAVQLFGVKWEMRTNIRMPDREEYEGIPMALSVMDLTRFMISPAKEDNKREFEKADSLLAV